MKQDVCAVILAAGRGSRMHSEIPKQFMSLGGKPMFLYSVQVFSEFADKIVVVTSGDSLWYVRELLQREELPVPWTVAEGGDERWESSLLGLKEAEGCDYVMIHDAARACVTAEVIRDSLESARRYGSGVAAVPVKDTIKRADADGIVLETPDRSSLWIIQTPQTFRTDWITEAYARMEKEAKKPPVTDDASVLEFFSGYSVRLSKGAYTNIKVTTEEDVPLAELILRKR